MVEEPAKAIEVFYSYAHKDEKWQIELEKQLSNLKRQGLISGWYDRKISPGIEWVAEIDKHLNTASIILLLVSPDFMASEYCYSIEMKQALERHEAGKARVIPILVRPTDWKGAPFDKLQVLPTNTKPITKWSYRDDAFLDIAKGIRRAIEELSPIKAEKEKMVALCQQYCEALHEHWKMLDFKGIMHIERNRAMGIPLTEIFVFPDVLVGVPEYETLEREDIYEKQDSKEKPSEGEREILGYQSRLQRQRKQFILQREDLQTVLAKKSRRLVILGDPGSGKSTLLRYLMLLLSGKREEFAAAFPNLVDISCTIPLYIPLASYAEFWRSSTSGERSLKLFFPKHLSDTYLEVYADFLQGQLEQGRVFLLFDGLDEIPDATLRMQVVRQIEAFTQSYSKNCFIVTSRIVGYREAPLAAGYQPYTLADFNDKQIRIFTQKWCPAYEHWVKETKESQYLKDAAIKDAERLFQATQRNPGVKRLAVNPLLLTILAIIQRQGIELPSHRIELFDLCAATLLETWVRARGQSPHFTKNELVKILRPLSFWMHEHPEVGAIPEEELIKQIVKQLLERKVTHYEHEAAKIAEKFLSTVRGETGILIERGKERYGFLHQTFEEYFAARELVIRKDRDDFIKHHLHDSRWREIILLAVGVIGILDSNEEGVTELVCDVIVKAGSAFEEWLYRDLLFAGLCLADDVGVGIECENEIIGQIVNLYITTPYETLQNAISSTLTSLSGTRAAIKVANLVLALLHKKKYADDSSDLNQQYQDEQDKLLLHYISIVLGRLKTNATDWVRNVIVMPRWLQAEGVRVLGLLSQAQPEVIDALLKAISNRDWRVKEASVRVLGLLSQAQPEVIDALLRAISDRDWRVKQASARALGQLGQGKPEVINTLLDALSNLDFEVRWVAAYALQLGQAQPEVIDALLKAIFDPDRGVREASARALGQLGQGKPEVIDALLKAISDRDWRVREASVCALGQLGQGKPEVIDALLKAIFDTDLGVSWIAISVLSQLGQEQLHLVDTLLNSLSSSNFEVREVAAILLSQLGQRRPEVVNILLKMFSDSHIFYRFRWAAAYGLVQVGSEQPHVIDISHKILKDPFCDLWIRSLASGLLNKNLTNPFSKTLESSLTVFGLVRKSNGKSLTNETEICSNRYLDLKEADTLIQINSEQRQIIDTLLVDLLSSHKERQSTVDVLVKMNSRQPHIIRYLLDFLPNPSRFNFLQQRNDEIKRIIDLLKLVGSGQLQVIDALLKVLLDPEFDMRGTVVDALAQLGQEQPQMVNALLKALSDSNPDVRGAAAGILGQLYRGQPQVIDKLLKTLSDSDVRWAAAQALGQFDQRQSKLIDALFQVFPDPAIGWMVVQALGQFDQEQPQVIDALLKALLDPDSDVRRVAVRALGQIGQGQPQAHIPQKG